VDTDRNLLFGVMALQADLIDGGRFVEACGVWAVRKAVPLAEILAERGWITPADRERIDALLQAKLLQHRGDARASLAEAASADVRCALAALQDPAEAASLPDAPKEKFGDATR
jgi:hypothetical protein